MSLPKTAIEVSTLPSLIETDRVYIVKENEYQYYVAMQCPCGCKDILHMNLRTKRRPRWEMITHSDGTISLSPSITKIDGCQSHFFLRHGLVIWCN